MKRLAVIFFALAIIAGCTRIEGDIQNETSVDGEFNLLEVLYASIADSDKDSQTKTYVDDTKVRWHGGDEISYFAGNVHNAKYAYNGENGADNVELTLVPETGISGDQLGSTYAVYPYSESNACVIEEDVEKILVTYPEQQSYVSNSFGRGANIMVAAGEHPTDENLYFRNACGYLVIKLYKISDSYHDFNLVKSIELTALGGEKIAGQGLITPHHDAAPEVQMMDNESSSTITLDCGEVELSGKADKPTEFWFAMPPTTLSQGFKIVVTPKIGNAFTMQTSKEVVIRRNDIQPMATLEYVGNTQTVNQLWYTTVDNRSLFGGYEEMKEMFDAPVLTSAYNPTVGKYVIEFERPLKVIKENAFKGCTTLTSISFPNTLTTIEDNAFEGTSALTSLTIPGSVNMIGVHAFMGTTSLSSVTFEPSPTNETLQYLIGLTITGVPHDRSSFAKSPISSVYIDRNILPQLEGNPTNISYGNTGFTGIFYTDEEKRQSEMTVTFGSHMTTIPAIMFEYAPVKEIVIPKNISTIEWTAFDSCNKLEKLTIEESDTPLIIQIHGYSQFKWSPISELTIHRNITCEDPYGNPADYDEDGAFTFGVDIDEEVLENLNPIVTIGSNVTAISPHMFAKSPIKNITLPNGVETIGEYAFLECDLMEELNLPSSLVTIDDYAFYGCDMIEELNLPSSLETIGNYAFYGCDKINNLNLPSSLATIGNYAFYGCDMINNLNLPSSLETIGNYAFSECDKINNLILPSSLESIGDGAFSNCSGLISLDLDGSVVGNDVFKNCDVLTTATLRAQKIGTGVLYDCDELTTLTIKGTVAAIDNDAFYSCEKLSSVTFDPCDIGTELTLGYQTYLTDDQSPFHDAPLTTLNLNRQINCTLTGVDSSEGIFAGKTGLIQVTMGEQVYAIHDYMFYGSGIQNINNNDENKFVIPSSVEIIGKGAFENCQGVINLVLPSRLQSLGDNAFRNCDAMTTAALNGVTIGSGVFYDCDALTALTIEGTVNSIGNDAFYSCGKLSSVTFAPSKKGTNLILGYQTYGTDEQSTFHDAPLTTVDLNREIEYTLTGVDSSEGIFAGKNNLTNITLGDQVCTIHNYMFYGSSIQSITIPENVSAIGLNAFTGDNLTTVTCLGTTTIPRLDTLPFQKNEGLSIYVPDGYKSTYQNSYNWGQYYPFANWRTTQQ